MIGRPTKRAPISLDLRPMISIKSDELENSLTLTRINWFEFPETLERGQRNGASLPSERDAFVDARQAILQFGTPVSSRLTGPSFKPIRRWNSPGPTARSWRLGHSATVASAQVSALWEPWRGPADELMAFSDGFFG